jgi:hypothetical protein
MRLITAKSMEPAYSELCERLWSYAAAAELEGSGACSEASYVKQVAQLLLDGIDRHEIGVS